VAAAALRCCGGGGGSASGGGGEQGGGGAAGDPEAATAAAGGDHQVVGVPHHLQQPGSGGVASYLVPQLSKSGGLAGMLSLLGQRGSAFKAFARWVPRPGSCV